MKAARLLFACALALAATAGWSAEKIKVLMIDGVNNHNWKETTRATKATLEQTGRFAVTVSTTPGKKASKEAWAEWSPKFSDYQVVVSNFNDGGRTLWSQATKQAFVKFVHDGGGFVPVHAANNSCGDWPEYNEIIGLGGWGGRKAGKSGVLIRKNGDAWAPCCENEGGSGGHGPQRDFEIIHDAPDHPVLQGLPPNWMHAKDELYSSLRGPAKHLTVLAHAVSQKTKTAEPMLMEIKYGKGTVMHIPLGHYNKAACECVGFQTWLARSTEYAATGKVTIKPPAEFPGPEKPVVVDPTKLVWPN